MKRMFSIFTALCIMLSSASMAFAEEKSSDMLLQIKPRIPDTTAYDHFNCTQREDNMSTDYYFDWYAEDGNKGMNVVCNDKGIITSLSIYDYNSEKENKIILDRISYDEAFEKAKLLAKNLNPSVSDTVRVEKMNVSENLHDNNFSFNLQRYENGIPVYGDNGSFQINLECTDIVRYYLNYTDNVSFEDASGLIDNETAKTAFNEKIGIEPEYVIERDYKKKTISTKIVYRYNTFDKFISAKNGEVIKPIGRNVYRGSSASSKNMALAESVSADGASFSVAENKQFEKMADLKTKEQLIEIIKKNKYIEYKNDFELSSYNTYYNEIENKFTAHFSFENKGEREEYKFLNATLDMKTGEIMSFYQNGIETKKIDEQSEKIAEEAVKNIAGEKFSEYKLREKTENSIIYERYVNGIVCPANTINIMIDENNKVKSYNISYTDVDFISADGIINKEEALEKLYEYNEYSLCYVADGDKFVLVYRFDEYCEFDAFTGERENTYEPGKIEYNDIDGHWAEDKINTLARYGVGFTDSEFKPEEKITQKEFAALLNSIYGNHISIYPKLDWDNVYSIIERRGVIKEEEISPDEDVTRETAAIFMIRSMGAEKYAKLEDIYNCPFEDVVTNKGYITMLYGLGIVSGTSSNTYSPNEILNRAEAAVMIYNYLINQ